MQFVGIRNLDIAARGRRGLAYNADYAMSALPTANIIRPAMVMMLGQEVKAGTANRFAVRMGAPANALVRAVTATFRVVAGPSGTTDLGAGVGVKEGATAVRYEIDVAVDPPAGLQNVEIRLEGGDTIFSRPGTLPVGDHAIPDFASALNDHLDTLAPSDDATLVFVVTSDVAGSATLGLARLDWSLIQTQAWPNALDETVRLDTTLSLSFGERREVALDALAVPAGRTPKRLALRLDAGGAFGAERVLGRIDPPDGTDGVEVAADTALAQRLVLDAERVAGTVACTGCLLHLSGAGPAELFAELLPDEAGYPKAGAALARATVAAPEGAEAGGWLTVPFEAPADLDPGTFYWLVLRGVTGTRRASLRPVPDGSAGPLAADRLAINRGGVWWRLLTALRPGLAPPQALVALLYRPGPQNRSAAVSVMAAGAAEGVRLDPDGGGAREVALPLPAAGGGPVRLLVDAYARGQLTIANVIQEYGLE